MRRSSARRAQVEPLAALAALAVLSFALGAYVLAADAARPPTADRSVAEPALRRAVEGLRPGSVVRPARLDALADLAPAGYAVNVTVRAANGSWTRGPRPPARANAGADVGVDAASERVTVRVGPGRVLPGRVRVVVWR